MQTVKDIWDFFRNQVLGMKWLITLLANLLTALGLYPANRWAGSLQFFCMMWLRSPSCSAS